MIQITDLDPPFQALLAELGRHPKISVATGSRAVILYVADQRLKKQVESKIPEEYREQVMVVLTGKIRPARHESTSKNPKKPPQSSARGRSRNGRRS